jgi:dolichol kinase
MPEEFTSRAGILKEEIMRKGIHLASGILMAALYTLFQKNVLMFVHLFFLLTIWFLELLRLRGVILVPFLREREKKKIGAHAFFMLGSFISIVLFDKQIAIASILMLTIGDAASGIAQVVRRGALESLERFRGTIKPPDVILIMFAVCLIVGYLTVDSPVTAISGAIGATIADGVHLRLYGISIDDNLSIPLYSGFLMSLVS